jgi:hypothetical protein
MKWIFFFVSLLLCASVFENVLFVLEDFLGRFRMNFGNFFDEVCLKQRCIKEIEESKEDS